MKVHRCTDCGVNTRAAREVYMVEVALWKAHGAGRGFLCVGCLEGRLGRKLTVEDFKLCPLNLRERISDRTHKFSR